MGRCEWCGQDMATADECTGNKKVEFPDGTQMCSVPYDSANGPRCPDCNVLSGRSHHPGCDAELCPRCDIKVPLISCGCLYDDGPDDWDDEAEDAS